MHKKDIYLLIAIAIVLALLILLVINIDKIFPVMPITLGGTNATCGS